MAGEAPDGGRASGALQTGFGVRRNRSLILARMRRAANYALSGLPCEHFVDPIIPRAIRLVSSFVSSLAADCAVVGAHHQACLLLFNEPGWREAVYELLHSCAVRTFCARNPLFERAGPRLELNALGAVSACVPAATAPGPTRNNGGCLTGGGSLGGTGIPPPPFSIVSESGHLSCDADHKKSLLSDNSCGSATRKRWNARSFSPQKQTPSAVHLGSEFVVSVGFCR